MAKKFSFLIFLSSFVCLIAILPPAFGKKIEFQRISLEEGLSQSSIYCILQDSKGFLWFGTEDGLNKFDGYNFKILKNDPENPQSLNFNNIKTLFEDRQGIIWVGTYGGGLNRYDRKKDIFHHFISNPAKTNTLSNNFINTICQDRIDNIWIGTESGLNCFVPGKNIFIRYGTDADSMRGLKSSKITCLAGDSRGKLWIGTDKGLYQFNKEEENFERFDLGSSKTKASGFVNVSCLVSDTSGNLWVGTMGNGIFRILFPVEGSSPSQILTYRHDDKNPNSLAEDEIQNLYIDKSGNLWIGTFSQGLNILFQDSMASGSPHFVHSYMDPGDPRSLSNNQVFSVLEDKSGVLWIGTDVGLNKYDRSIKKFEHTYHDPSNPASLSHNHVYSIIQDSSGAIWVATYGGGINKLEKNDSNDSFWRFHHIRHDPINGNSLSNDLVRCIAEDKRGSLWIGTYGSGLDRMVPSSKEDQKPIFIHFISDPENSYSLSNNFIRCIYECSREMLWIGTDAGLNRYDRATNRFHRFNHDPNNPGSLSNDLIYCILEDNQGLIWIGTLNGLNRWDPGSQTFINYHAVPENPDSLSNSEILTIFQDSRNCLWVGTSGGLNKYHPETESFSYYTMKAGLPNDLVYAILEDEDGYLWLSTNKGLSKFNTRTEQFQNYDVDDGLQSNEFNLGSCLRDREGRLYFGGINGFNFFFPDEIINNPFVPPVVITDFQVFNKSVTVGKKINGRIILENSISETNEIVLSHKENVFSFEFAAMSFVSPQKNEYKYMMEGFEPTWNLIKDRHFVSYTNLPSGKYVFRVIASNNDGIWNREGASLKIRISPPFWNTWWFRILAGILVLMLIAGILRARTYKYKEKTEKLDELVRERTKELDNANIVLQQEIQERKNIERRLLIEKTYLDQFFENAPEGIVMSENDGKIIRVNDEFLKMFGYEIEDVIGKRVDSLISSDSTLSNAEAITKQVAKGSKMSFEALRKRKDGKEIYVSVLASPIFVDNNQVATFGIYRDISDRKKIDQKIKQTLKELEAANKELKDFAYIVSHDLKAPLRAIGQLAVWIAEDYAHALDKEGQRQLSLLIGRVKRMDNFINGILQYSRVGRYKGKRLKIDLNKLVQEIITRLKPQDGITIEIIDTLPSVWIDRARIDLIFQHLISNALKYMDKPHGEIKIGCTDENSQWKFSVSDNGPGIHEKYHQKIFQIFQTLEARDKRESTGVGLSLVKKIVEIYGGEIWLKSKLDQGCTFYFTLPKKITSESEA
ncbi:MAG: PAS domain S-box protein [Candidatus Aminicenantes bacterium]|nr:PAS domain S-box protein [Candidatus Aminicenantes bacterium]